MSSQWHPLTRRGSREQFGCRLLRTRHRGSPRLSVVSRPVADYYSVSVDSEFADVERRLVEYLGSMVNSPYTARSLRRLFAQAGLGDVTVENVPIVFTELDTFSTMIASTWSCRAQKLPV
jgi:hypothetical protein